MTDLSIGTGLTDVKVETNYSAPAEQKSPEMVTTEPTSVEAQPEPKEVITESPKEPTIEEKSNASARQAIEDKIRAENAERQLKALQPKEEPPERQPDINDKATWGTKYKDAPNDLETFLKAHADWARAEGKREERTAYTAAQEQQSLIKLQTEVIAKEQQSRAKHSDYDAVINPIVPVIKEVPLLKDFVARHPMGTEVAYELGKNPLVLEQLLRSDMWSAGEQLLGIAARLKAPKQPELTSAPEPIKPVGSRETVKPRLSELADKDINGYIAEMNKRERAAKRRPH